jgi:hypothetical protein
MQGLCCAVGGLAEWVQTNMVEFARQDNKSIQFNRFGIELANLRSCKALLCKKR